MTILFWASAGLMLFVYLGYPLTLWLLGKIRGRVAQRRDLTPKVTLVIAAYNEEDTIAEKLENSLALDYPREQLEIVVASESSDNTNAIVGQFASRGIKLRAFTALRRGKASTLYACVPQAQGKIVVFSDANAMYQADAIRKLVRNFADPRIGCVSGRLEYVESATSCAAGNESRYWRYEVWKKGLESRLFSLTGANGSIFALRKELYSPLSEARGDDFELPIRVLLQGYGAILDPDAVSRESNSLDTQAEFRRRVRIVEWNFVSALWLARQAVERGKALLFFQLVLHRLLRWLTPLFLAAMLISSALLPGGPFRVISWLQALLYLLALAGWLFESRRVALPRLWYAPYYFAALQLATLVAIGRILATPASSTWEKVR